MNRDCSLYEFRFTDPRLQRIYEEFMELVGPGPAAFFRDACWLMENKGVLHSTSHLVGHLLREIESTFRAVLKPIGASNKDEQSTSQKAQIEAICNALGVARDSAEAQAWFQLADKLHGVAHRRGLEGPRAPTEAQELWASVQTLLPLLLDRMRSRFLEWVKLLDELLDSSRKSPPSANDLKKLTNEVPNNAVTRSYFFDRLDNPEWLEPLWKKGFFRHPPPPVRDEEQGTISFPPWPEASYLARMARHKPELVAQIIQQMDDTENTFVQGDLVEAMLSMSAEVSVQLADKAKKWAESPYWLLPAKLGQLVAYLSTGGESDKALEIAGVLLDVLPDTQKSVNGAEGGYPMPPEPRARFDVWDYEQILKKHYPEVARAAGLAALQLLCGLLDKAIAFSRRQPVHENREDYCYIWRPAIEDHGQNLGDTVKDALASGVWDVAELVVHSGKISVDEVVRELESRRWKIFHRLALHLLRNNADQAMHLVRERLVKKELFDDIHIQHEYVLLLRTCFSKLSEEDKRAILGWIEAGPDVECFRRWRERETESPPSEEDVTRYRETWQRDRLAWIGQESLPTAWQERYRRLVEKFGEPEHPEFPVYSEVGWVGPTSPKTKEEIKGMSIQELVDFLKEWTPPKSIFGEPSQEGLGGVVASVVAEDPTRFAPAAPSFQGLDPTYVRAVLTGLRDSLRQQREAFVWAPVLQLCQWVVEQPREIPNRRVRDFDADPDWGWTRKAIADLLSAGFEDGQGTIPIDLRDKVWSILKPLTDDPDPTREHEEKYGGTNMDPATLSLNTTRGKAMHAVIRYALWVRRHLEKGESAPERLQRGFEEMPEVRDVLDAYLDVRREPSLAIRAVYGQWFPWLVLLDTEWAGNNAARIFPLDAQQEAFFDAAWSTYVAFCRPYDNVFDVIREQYRHAVERIGCRRDDTRWLANPDERLAKHLMVFYWRGKLSLENPLLTAFWEKAPDGLRGHAIEFVGRALKQTEGDIPAEILDRRKQLWELRLAIAKKAQQPSDFEKEMAAFGWWFVSDKFDVGWAIAQLSESLQLVHQTDLDHMVLEHLARTVETHPVESAQCLRIIAEGDREGWNLSAGRDHVRRILEVALRNPTAGEEAERIIHYLGSRGFLEFRNLLEGERRG